MVAEQNNKETVKAEEYGSVLHYLAGSKADEFLTEEETLKTIGLKDVNRGDLYIELTIMNMFVLIKQYISWEKNEEVYTKTLDQMHFLLFHQLKEYSNYDEDDIEQLHERIFQRYDQYSEEIQNSVGETWSKTLSRALINNIDDEIDDTGVNIIAKNIEKFYQAIPNILNNI